MTAPARMNHIPTTGCANPFYEESLFFEVRCTILQKYKLWQVRFDKYFTFLFNIFVRNYKNISLVSYYIFFYF